MHSMEEEDGVDVDMVGCGWIVTKYLVASPPWLLVVVFFFANGEQIGHQIRTEDTLSGKDIGPGRKRSTTLYFIVVVCCNQS